MKTIIVFLILLVPGSTLLAQDNSGHNHDEHLGKLITSYLQLKEALTEDDFDTAQSHLATFSEEVLTSREMNHHPAHSEKHKEHHDAMSAAVEQASKAESIDQLRDSFAGISEQLIKAVENLGHSSGPLHIQFCPMVNDGNGGHWLSEKEEILNPYYGTRMLKCGSIIKTIHS